MLPHFRCDFSHCAHGVILSDEFDISILPPNRLEHDHSAILEVS
jgi:hypothetical protein